MLLLLLLSGRKGEEEARERGRPDQRVDRRKEGITGFPISAIIEGEEEEEEEVHGCNDGGAALPDTCTTSAKSMK
ncbi:hypothetical protein M8C21_015563 [Ambrosia artemisiifolia]|uniref:Uncharacterized protein n=1 Tax=Ambrosia artemisiifolia TaxID=4212 RepID=A0AAD5D487_AMBAR|nr:hypothetical protein M8C21_015563 [Ambrosia artemisiifolia]